MNSIDFNNKTFSLVENSDKGKVNSDTVFKYKQDGDLVTADYYGGPIKYGKIIAKLRGTQLDMLYECITDNDELKAGKAVSNISFTENGKMKMQLYWKWLNDGNGKGVSQFVEN